jgi:bacteriorhodopsin
MHPFFADITLLASTLQVYEWVYFLLLIASMVAVYLVLVARIGDELPRSTADKIFFLMLGIVSIIWILSKVAPSMA